MLSCNKIYSCEMLIKNNKKHTPYMYIYVLIFFFAKNILIDVTKQIRAVAEQRSLPESGFANKTKMFFRAKNKR